MQVSDLSIENFRGIKSGRITFGQFTVLVGANNSGKTTVIEALALLLGRDRLVRSLTEHDFHGSRPAVTDRINIVATITGFPTNDPRRHSDWFRYGRCVIKWRDVEDGTLKSARSKRDDELACQIAFAARFDRDSLEVDTIRYFYDDPAHGDPFDENANITQVPIALLKEMGFFLVPAARTWDKMMSFGSELFRRVVSYVGGQPAAAVLDERDRLRDPRPPLEADPKLAELVGAIDADIKRLLGQTSKLKLRLTTTDSEGVLEAVMPHYVEGAGIPQPARRQGSGLISLQTLILLIRFGHLRVQKGEGFLMAIEEPELHVSPSLQRRLLHLMQSLATQTIVTTHSPTVAAVPGPHQLVLIINRSGALDARPLLAAPLTANAPNLVRSLFLTDRHATVAAIMQRHVLVPEGKLEASWLRLLARVTDFWPGEGNEDDAPSFTHDVGVIPTKDAQIVETFHLLADVHPSVLCLADGDQQGQIYVRQLCGLATPPRVVAKWPDGWQIENVVTWIVSAAPGLLEDPELMEAGFPNQVENLADALLEQLKTNEIAHSILADAISRNVECRARVRHVLQFIGRVASGAPIVPGSATPAPDANGTTTVWTFVDAI